MTVAPTSSNSSSYATHANTVRAAAIRRVARTTRPLDPESPSTAPLSSIVQPSSSNSLCPMPYSPSHKPIHSSPNSIQPHHATSISLSDPVHVNTRNIPKRISQAYLLTVTLILLIIAGFGIPGGLTPRRQRSAVLQKRVKEHLDVISKSDPNEILPDGPLPIDKIHREGIVHRGVWIFALDSHLRLLLCWRASHMKTCPSTWSTVGEHAVANETFEDAANRGLLEEARFIARPRVYPAGIPFFYSYIYNEGIPAQRVDKQWTQAYVVLPRGDALDFRSIDDKEAQAMQAEVENSRYQGMSLPEIVRHAIQRPDFFCNEEQVGWILRAIPLVIRIIKTRDKRLFKAHLHENWLTLVRSGSPVCCESSEHEKEINQVDLSKCGRPCDTNTTEPSDLEILTEYKR